MRNWWEAIKDMDRDSYHERLFQFKLYHLNVQAWTNLAEQTVDPSGIPKMKIILRDWSRFRVQYIFEPELRNKVASCPLLDQLVAFFPGYNYGPEYQFVNEEKEKLRVDEIYLVPNAKLKYQIGAELRQDFYDHVLPLLQRKYWATNHDNYNRYCNKGEIQEIDLTMRPRFNQIRVNLGL